jgi:S-DNA-T family DNA segregation ATPase FtsK/SpoIIIE
MQDTMPADGNRFLRDFGALSLFFLAVFLMLSLSTYSQLDPDFNQQVSQGYSLHNKAGVVGAYISGALVDLFGLGSFVWPFVALWAALASLLERLRPVWWRGLGLILIYLCFVSGVSHPWLGTSLTLNQVQGGGFLGRALFELGEAYFQTGGAFLVWLFVLLFALQLSIGGSWTAVFKGIGGRIYDLWCFFREFFARKGPRDSELVQNKQEQPLSPASIQKSKKDEGQKSKHKKQGKALPKQEEQKKPAINLLKAERPLVELLSPVKEDREGTSQEVLNELSEKLLECLTDFGVQGEVQKVQPGPVVTMFEFKPAPGVKISRISNLHDDLALALKAMAVRIEAPIPGKDSVGIEIPNKNRETVFLRELIESAQFTKNKNRLPLALGKDIQGQPRVEDLSRMPHLLVAGATGAGKSVCLNTFLMSLLFQATPDELKLLLIDPKRIEMASYADLPHLVHPVVTDMNLAKTALDWAVYEMEQRYDAMARLGVRNIDSYNSKLSQMEEQDREGLEDLQSMPYLVIIIDEMADLMLTAGKEVEMTIVRLAQLARAAGIHLILATQRPSVDVVTGLIKANFPSRISFQVSSKHDSRTILDTVGAQYLLGQGDMLYKASAGKLHRIHGAYVSDEEINAVIDFWKQKRSPEFALDFNEWKSESGKAEKGEDGAGDDVADDPLYAEAVQFVMEQGKASISMIQRRLRIGFNRAARYIEQMEQDGVIGPQEGSKQRTVLKQPNG